MVASVIRRQAKTTESIVKVGARASVAVTMATYITDPCFRYPREIQWGKLMQQSQKLVEEIGRMTAFNIPYPSESIIEGGYAQSVHDYIRDLKRQNRICIAEMQELERLM